MLMAGQAAARLKQLATALGRSLGGDAGRILGELERLAVPQQVLRDAANFDRLEALGLIAEIDESALVAYCNDYAEYLTAQAKVDTLNAADLERLPGFIQSTPTGYQAKSIWLTIRDKAHERLMRSEAKFGIGAAARSRVRPGDVDQPELPGMPDKPATGWGSI